MSWTAGSSAKDAQKGGYLRTTEIVERRTLALTVVLLSLLLFSSTFQGFAPFNLVTAQIDSPQLPLLAMFSSLEPGSGTLE
jgi:hypothetical protein